MIGADGLHSTVRDLVFGPERQFEKQLGYRVAVFEIEGYRPRDELVYVTYTTPGRQVGRVSLRGDRTMFSFLFVSDRMTSPEPLDAKGRKALLHQVFDDAGWECPQILQAMDQISDVYYDRVSQIRMDGWSKGRVMLIGDAAACVSLLAGEGAGLAMTEAYVLAGELNRAGHDYQAAYRRYEQLLRPSVEGKQKSVRYLASAFVPKTRVGVWLRNQVTKLMGFPPVNHYFLGATCGTSSIFRIMKPSFYSIGNPKTNRVKARGLKVQNPANSRFSNHWRDLCLRRSWGDGI